MSSMRNKVQLIGNLGKDDPIITNLESGKKVAKFSMATNETYTNAQGEKIEKSEWHTVVSWGKTAELIEKYVKAKASISIEGKLTSHSYEDKEGVKRYVTEVLAHEVLFGSK